MKKTAEIINLRDPDRSQIDPDPNQTVARFEIWWEKQDREMRAKIRKIVRVDRGWEQHLDDARGILEFLNSKRTGRGFRPLPTTLRPIAMRLHEGATVADCRAIIVIKARQVADGKFDAKYLRPETLFNATKFESYLGELGQ